MVNGFGGNFGGNPFGGGIPGGQSNILDLSQPQITKRKGGGVGVLGGQTFDLDKKNRIKTDPVTGEKIPKKRRRKFSDLAKNPFGVTIGTAVDPNFSFQNLPPDPSLGLLGSGGGIPGATPGGLFDLGGPL